MFAFVHSPLGPIGQHRNKGPRKEGAGNGGSWCPMARAAQGLQPPTGFRQEEESYSRQRSSWSPDPGVPRALCLGTAHPAALPQPCQALGTQAGCLLKDSAGDAGSPASASSEEGGRSGPQEVAEGLQHGMFPGHTHGCEVYGCCAGNGHISCEQELMQHRHCLHSEQTPRMSMPMFCSGLSTGSFPSLVLISSPQGLCPSQQQG